MKKNNKNHYAKLFLKVDKKPVKEPTDVPDVEPKEEGAVGAVGAVGNFVGNVMTPYNSTQGRQRIKKKKKKS
jgi:hypothetical protein